MLASGVDWTNVLLALIAAVPGIIAAVYAGRVHHQVKTPSGTSIGKQIENTLHTSLATPPASGSMRATSSPHCPSASHPIGDIKRHSSSSWLTKDI